MGNLPPIFKKFTVQVLYFLLMPVFFFSFALLYRPFDIGTILDMGKGLYAFNVTMLSCIVMVSLVFSRLIYYAVRNIAVKGMGWYVFWCFCEIMVISLFVALYIWLMQGRYTTFFSVMVESVRDVFLTLLPPYVMVHLSLMYNAKDEELKEVLLSSKGASDASYIRFYDVNNNEKFAVHFSSMLYITAQDNYLRIYYLDNNKVTSYLLRNSITNIEKYCADYGLVRCHRSYIINSQRVKLLKKEREGYFFVELDSPEPIKLPVSKRYYESLTMML